MNKPKPKKPTKAGTAPAPQPGTGVSTEVLSGKGLILVQNELPDHLKTQGPARGSENVGTEDLLIPRLVLLQAISDEVQQGNPLYVKGAQPGMMMNSASKQLYGNKVQVVLCHYDKLYLVWKDRQKGGGFFGAYPDQVQAQARADEEGGKAAGVEVMDTPTHLCLLVDPATFRVDEIMVPMARTKAKVSRQINSMVRMTGQDRFARVYEISTVAQKNAKGNFYNFAAQQVGYPAKPLYEAAKKLWESVSTGGRTVAMDTRGMSGAEAPGGTGEEDETGM